MKSRLIKFACHNCGTKLAVPPEMAGVTDQCPKCGTTITAPPESTLEPVRRKTKFAPVPKEPSHAHAEPVPHMPQARPEMPSLPGWTASELADALKPPAPLPAYVPLAQSSPHSQPQTQPLSAEQQHGLLSDPPAIPDPGPLFVPKRRAHSEGAVAIAPPPAVAKQEHPVLGSILDAPTLPRGRAATQTAAPLPPPELPLPQPGAHAFPSPSPSKELAWGELASPVPTAQPPAAETPAPAPVPVPPPAEQPAESSLVQAPAEDAGEQAASSASVPAASAPPAPWSEVRQTETPEQAPAAPEIPFSPTALMPQSLPDPRAAEEAAMPGMGEVLAGGQVAQDPAAPPDTRDHRPLLHVPFLPVAESPVKGRRSSKRKLYILGVILFLVVDAVLIDAVVLHWFFKVPAGALSGDAATTERTEGTATTGHDAAPAPNTAEPSVPPIGAPSDFAAKQPESASASPAPPKPASPPMAIPLPGHSSSIDVPTATPIPATGPAEPSAPKTAQPTPAPPAPAVASTNPPPAPAQENMKPETATATAPKAPPAPAPSAPPAAPAVPPSAEMTAAAPSSSSPSATSPSAPAPAPTANGTVASVAALMGPQPTAPVATVDGDPPWLKRIAPTYPAIDGTPLLPSNSSQPVAQPPPLPPAPAPAEGAAMPPPVASAPPPDGAAPSPGALAATSPAAAPTPTSTPAQAPPGENPSLWISKTPEEAQSALTVLRNFLAAPTWQERAAYVQKPDATKPAMEKHAAKYGDGPIKPATIKFVDRHPGRDGGPPYCMFEIDGGDLKHEVLVLIEQPAEGQPRIDWATFVEFKDDLLLKFLETQGEPNQSFRVMLSRKHYFAKDVPDLASKDSFQVQQPNDRFDGHVFLPKSTALSKKLASQLGWNQNMPVIVELAWRTNGKLHWVEIVRIVSYGWRG